MSAAKGFIIERGGSYVQADGSAGAQASAFGFLPGADTWADPKYNLPVKVVSVSPAGSDDPTSAVLETLNASIALGSAAAKASTTCSTDFVDIAEDGVGAVVNTGLRALSNIQLCTRRVCVLPKFLEEKLPVNAQGLGQVRLTITDDHYGIKRVDFVNETWEPLLKNFDVALLSFVGGSGLTGSADGVNWVAGSTPLSSQVIMMLTQQLPKTPSAYYARVQNGFSEECVTHIDPIVTFGQQAAAKGALVSLKGNAPNPFSSTTRIRFTVQEVGKVQISVYDVAGRLVRRLAGETYEPGTYDVDWDGTDARGEAASSGVFIYRVESGTTTETGRMILAR